MPAYADHLRLDSAITWELKIAMKRVRNQHICLDVFCFVLKVLQLFVDNKLILFHEHSMRTALTQDIFSASIKSVPHHFEDEAF